MKKPNCYNCQFSGQTFKLDTLTHCHCMHPKYKEEDFISGKLSAWDTLQEFWNTCDDFKAIAPMRKTDSEVNPNNMVL